MRKTITLSVVILLCACAHTWSGVHASAGRGRTAPAAQENPDAAPLIFFKDLLLATDEMPPAGNESGPALEVQLKEGYWKTVDPDKNTAVYWQVDRCSAAAPCDAGSDSAPKARISFVLNNGVIQKARLTFVPRILVSKTTTTEPALEVRSVEYSLQSTDRPELLKVTGPGPVMSSGVGENLYLRRSPSSLLLGAPFVVSDRAWRLGDNFLTAAADPAGEPQPMVEKVLFVRPEGIPGAPKLTFRLREDARLGFSQGAKNNFLTLGKNSTAVFTQLEYRVATNGLEAKLDRLALTAKGGSLTANGLRLNFDSVERFEFGEFSLSGDGITGRGGRIQAAVKSGSVNLGGDTNFSLSRASEVDLKAVELTSAGPTISRLSVTDSTLAMSLLFGRMGLGEVGSFFVQGGALVADLQKAVWEADKNSPTIKGVLSDVQLPITSGQLKLNERTALSLEPGSSLSTDRLSLDTGGGQQPTITGSLNSTLLLVRRETPIQISNDLSFDVRDRATVSSDDREPLTIKPGAKHLTGRSRLSGDFNELRFNDQVAVVLQRGLTDVDVTVLDDELFDVHRLWFRGELGSASVPFGADGALKVQGGAMRVESDGLAGTLGPGGPKLRGKATLDGAGVLLPSDLRFNAATRVRVNSGKRGPVDLEFTPTGPPLTATFHDATFDISAGTEFKLPGGIALTAGGGGSVRVGAGPVPFQSVTGAQSPVGTFAVALPASKIEVASGSSPFLSDADARLTLTNQPDGSVRGEGITLAGAKFKRAFGAGRVLEGAVKFENGVMRYDAGAASAHVEGELSGSVLPTTLARIKMPYLKLTHGAAEPTEWFFPVEFEVAIAPAPAAPVVIPPTRVTLVGPALSSASFKLGLPIAVNVSEGRGKYVKPNDLERGTKNKGKAKNRQEAWRKAIAVKKYKCEEHVYLEPTAAGGVIMATPDVTVRDGRVEFAFADGSVTAPSLPAVFDGCSDDEVINQIIAEALVRAIQAHDFAKAIAPPVGPATQPQSLIGTILTLEVLKAIRDGGQNLEIRVSGLFTGAQVGSRGDAPRTAPDRRIPRRPL